MKVLSLFDGIACARVALERSGFKVDKYYASEVDKYAIQISQKNYPDIFQIGDVRKIGALDFMIDGIKIDLVIGGSPCQDLSVAGKRAGLEGKRSGLFYEYVRLVQELKPKFFILENIASIKKEWQELMSKELWGIKPVMINASLVSAQNRKRLFWVGQLEYCNPFFISYKQIEIPQPKDREILLRDILEPKVDDSFVVKNKSNTIRTSGRGSGINDKHNWDTIRIGNIGTNAQGYRVFSIEGKSVPLMANGGGLGGKTGLYMIQPVALRNRGEGKKPEYNKTNKANSLITVQTDSMVDENSIIRKLTPIECERLQGLPDNYTEGVSNTQRYKALGNAFNVDVVAHILRFIKEAQ